MTPSEIAAWHDGAAAWMESREDFHIRAAATIRAQAEALKIATEALERIEKMRVNCSWASQQGDMADRASKALARIKELT